MVVPELFLTSGKKIPVIGFGTGGFPASQSDQRATIFLDAIQVGYRHFDTAEVYHGAEEALGKAIAEALRRGLIKDRNDVFITSKLWCTHAHPPLVLPALKTTLERLGMEYVDLYLIHWPVRLKEGAVNVSSSDILPFDIKGTWKAMEECCKLGLAKLIGVSNFSTRKVEILLQRATIPPAINQVELNVAWKQEKLREYCKEKGIAVYAYSPLGAKGYFWGTTAVMESPVVNEIAFSKGKTVAQVALRWIYEQGVGMVVRSSNKDRMQGNLEILDWELTSDEVMKIKNNIPQRRAFLGEFFVAPDQTVEDLWDAEQ